MQDDVVIFLSEKEMRAKLLSAHFDVDWSVMLYPKFASALGGRRCRSIQAAFWITKVVNDYLRSGADENHRKMLHNKYGEIMRCLFAPESDPLKNMAVTLLAYDTIEKALQS